MQTDSLPEGEIPTTSGITGIKWVLTEMNGKSTEQLPSIMQNAFIYLNDSLRIHGNGGCNIINGHYTLSEGNRIQFKGIVSTMKACQGMEAESEFLKLLEKADNFYVDSDELVLNRAKMAPLLRFRFAGRM